jgi:BatD DUF11 like domain
MWLTRLLCFFVLCIPLKSMANATEFTLEISAKSVALNDVVQVQYTITNGKNITAFNPPVFKNFKVIQGPDQGSGYSSINGVIKEYISISYILQPLSTGTFTIPAASAVVDGKNILSNTEKITITAASANVQPQYQPFFQAPRQDVNQDFILQKGENVKKKIKENILLRLIVSKKSCFIGEPIEVTYKLYTRLKSDSKILHRPSFNGFSVYEMLDNETIQGGEETYRGKVYNVYVLRRVQLYPLRTGNLTLDTMSVDNEVSFMEPGSSAREADIFELLDNLQNGGSAGGGIIKENQVVYSNVESIQVNPLPENKEPRFQGAVGNFSITAALESDMVHQNDIGKLVIKISGAGNFPMVFAPEVIWPENFSAFEPITTENYNKTLIPLSGEKVFTIPFTVKKKGDFEIPPIKFYFFNPTTKEYSASETVMLPLTVLGPKIANPKDIKMDTNTSSNNGFIYLLIGGCLLLLLAIVLIIFKKKIKPIKNDENVFQSGIQHSNEITENKGELLKFKLRRLKEALEAGTQSKFYDTLTQVLDYWVIDIHEVSDLNNWKSKLSEKGISNVVINLADAMRQEVDLAKYTPVIDAAQMEESYKKIEFIVSHI